ncbi:hypothetical protein D9M68_879250 [compost metagenome]
MAEALVEIEEVWPFTVAVNEVIELAWAVIEPSALVTRVVSALTALASAFVVSALVIRRLSVTSSKRNPWISE